MASAPPNLFFGTKNKWDQIPRFSFDSLPLDQQEIVQEQLDSGEVEIQERDNGHDYYYGTVHKRMNKRFGFGRWCHTKNKDGTFEIVSEGMFNKAGFRHGYCREVYANGFVYDGWWDNGVNDVPPGKERNTKLSVGN